MTNLPKSIFLLSCLLLPVLAEGTPLDTASRKAILESRDQDYPYLFELYQYLHRNPELSFHEEKTADRIAEELQKAGLEVTKNVGGHGLVGVLKNGDGPTILLRTDLDALPVKEETGKPYASEVTTKDDSDKVVSVMHACGHDVHMTAFVGAARLLSGIKDKWQGTLVMIAQPAEEKGAGARLMLKDRLYERFPKPDFAVAQHVAADMPSGTVGYVAGYALANVDSVDILVRGIGGHGAYPHKTKDPVLLAAQIVVALQTIVSRETSPIEPAVVTVGSIHGGTKHNIIPNEVKLQLTLRSYTDEVRESTIKSIKRITKGLGEAAGLPKDLLPVVSVKDEFTPATYNDPDLVNRLAGTLAGWIGGKNVIATKKVMGGEDFSRYGRTKNKVPICMFWLGAVEPDVYQKSIDSGKSLPSLHSSLFAPDPESTIKTGVANFTSAVLELAGKK